MIKLKDMLDTDVTLGKVYTDKDKPPFQVKEEKLDEALKLCGNYLASITIEGDPSANSYKANVKVQTHKKTIKVRP